MVRFRAKHYVPIFKPALSRSALLSPVRHITPQDTKLRQHQIAVAKILGDGMRKRTKSFSELQRHYLFEDRFGRPAKGNDKGKVEGLVRYARRNFMVRCHGCAASTSCV